MNYLTIAEVAPIIRKSAVSVATDVTRNPSALPPFARIGGRILFDLDLIPAWFESRLVNYKHKPVIQIASNGRPRKLKQQ